jgi:hypothetical protein
MKPRCGTDQDKTTAQGKEQPVEYEGNDLRGAPTRSRAGESVEGDRLDEGEHFILGD